MIISLLVNKVYSVYFSVFFYIELRLEKYHQLGTKEKLVERFLEAAIKDCGPSNERAARLVLYLLTEENGTRPLKTRSELVADLEALDLGSEVDKLENLLKILVGTGLILLVREAPADRYQLIHDYLVSFIRQQQAPALLEELAAAKEQHKQTEEQLRQTLRQLEQALSKEKEERKRAENAEIEVLVSKLTPMFQRAIVIFVMILMYKLPRRTGMQAGQKINFAKSPLFWQSLQRAFPA